jgi:hypothetical protein
LAEEVEALQEGQTVIQDIPVELLVAHSENSNFMNAEMSQKLRRHIERTGRYEPIIVRPHPGEKGKFQVINGHNRLRVLKALNYKTVHSVIWDIDDNQTRLYLATLNRLSGSDVPERRAALLENLFTTFNTNELSSLLPDSEKQIDELRRLSGIDLEKLTELDTIEEKFKVPVILTFMLEETEAKGVALALDLVITRGKNLSRCQALASLARFYLERCEPLAGVEYETND